MPNADKSEHLNELLTSKHKRIVASTLQYLKGFIQYQNEFYLTDKR